MTGMARNLARAPQRTSGMPIPGKQAKKRPAALDAMKGADVAAEPEAATPAWIVESDLRTGWLAALASSCLRIPTGKEDSPSS